MLFSLLSCSSKYHVADEVQLLTLTPSERSSNNNDNLVEVTVGSVSRVVSGEGILVYPNTETLTCDFHNARLVSLNIKKGDMVKKGDVIAEFEIEYNKSELASLESELEIFNKQYKAGLISYESAVMTAQQQLDNLSKQYEANPSPALKAQVAKADIQLKKAETSLEFYKYENGRRLDSLKQSIEDFERRISDNTVYAPFDGVIGNVDYLPAGNIITPGSSICTIYSPDVVWIATNFDISYGMRYNAPAEIEVSVTNDRFTGRIITAPDLFGGTTGRVIVIPDSPINISPNDRMRRITVKSSRYKLDNVLTLPSKVIHNEDGKRYVYVYEDGISKKRYVTLGLSALNTSQVLDGLSAGQWIVAN